MTPEELEAFKERLGVKIAENRQTFEGEYQTELSALISVSKAEIDTITPDTANIETIQ